MIKPGGKVRVAYFERKPDKEYGSIETVFRVVRSLLPGDISCELRTSRFRSEGLLKRVYNVFEAAARQDQVNHIGGDVHFLTLLMSRRRTILTIHDLVGLTRGTWGQRKLIEWLWYRLPIRKAAFVTAVSSATREQLVKLLGPSHVPIRVVPDCISPVFVPMPQPFRNERPIVLAVGTAPNKNLVRLAEALRGIPCTLRIVGMIGPEQREALLKTGVDYENRHHLNEDEMLETYASSDLLAFPSMYEGFGMPILEAQTVERPVVTSRVTSMPEVAGDGACLVDPLDVWSIRAGVLRVIHDAPYREAILAAGRVNRERFTAARIAEAYAQVYREVSAN